MAKLINRLWTEEHGQGLVEYTLVVLLIAIVFWLGLRDSGIAEGLSKGWEKVVDCITSPMSCSA